jgi:phospholipid transport system substrate-binding protein
MMIPSSTPCPDRRAQRLAAAAALLLGALAGHAGAQQSPRDVVQTTADQVLAVLAQKDLSRDARREQVKRIVLANTDFDTLCRLALARNWNSFTPEQQAEFKREFESHLSATYGRRLDNYRNERIAIVGERKEANGDVTVQTRVVRGGGSNDFTVDYRLRQSNGQWKVIDVIPEQVSLVANFRSQFQEIISAGGPERLLQVLREKTAKGEEFKSP